MKQFNEMQNVGKVKYLVNFHDGVKAHRDGSPFFDVAPSRASVTKTSSSPGSSGRAISPTERK
jgi:hypothetical protein